MDKGSEVIYHVVAVRMRLTGSGSLEMHLNDLDDTNDLALVPFTMAATTPIEPTRLCNFQSQRVKFSGTISALDEYFIIKRLVIFVKPIAMEYPM